MNKPMLDVYNEMLVADLKIEIDRRLQGEAKPYNSKTRKCNLVYWLLESDEKDLAEIKAGQAEIDKRNAEHEAAERKAFRRPPVTPLTPEERITNYYRQNGGRFLTRRQERQVGRMALKQRLKRVNA